MQFSGLTHDIMTHIALEIESGSQRPGYKGKRKWREPDCMAWENVRGNPAHFRLSVSLEEKEARSPSLWAAELRLPSQTGLGSC